jgi:hypothetical protein
MYPNTLLHSITQTLTTHMHTHPYAYTYANPTLMSTSRSGDSRSHHWRLVVDGNVAYHLTHNAENPGINLLKGATTRIWTLVGSVLLDVLPLDYTPIRLLTLFLTLSYSSKKSKNMTSFVVTCFIVLKVLQEWFKFAYICTIIFGGIAKYISNYRRELNFVLRLKTDHSHP